MDRVEALFTEVYASPSDDGPRIELAELLRERDDPRGEFIELELEPKPSRTAKSRRKALLDAHADEWLAPLHGALVTRSVKWARGFPVAGKLAKRDSKQADAMIGAPALATLRELDVGSGNVVLGIDWLRRFLFAPSLRNLEVLTGARRALLSEMLIADPAWGLRRLELEPEGGGGIQGEQRMLEEIAIVAERADAASGLPTLTELSLSYAFFPHDPEREYPWLGTTRFGRQLRVLRANAGPELVSRWLPVLQRLPDQAALERLELFALGEFALERTRAGWTRLTGAMPKRAKDAEVVERSLGKMLDKLGDQLEVEIAGFAR